MCTKRELASFRDALETFNTNFCKKDALLKNFSGCKKVSFDLKKCSVLHNLALSRLKADCPENAYPGQDRDISSVYYHMNVLKKNPYLIDEPLPVIAVIQNGIHDIYLLLDGVHRFVAANQLKLTHLTVILVYLPINIINFR